MTEEDREAAGKNLFEIGNVMDYPITRSTA